MKPRFLYNLNGKITNVMLTKKEYDAIIKHLEKMEELEETLSAINAQEEAERNIDKALPLAEAKKEVEGGV